MTDYDQACREAATRQGLDPVTTALAAAGVAHTVEQTGGMTMVVRIDHGDGRHVLVTHDEDGYMVGWYVDAGTDCHDWDIYPLDEIAATVSVWREP